MTIKVLAIDLERTLITNAINRQPRPGLHDFLTFCLDNFERVAIFTAVTDEMTWEVLRELESKGAIPDDFIQRVEYIYWDGEYKDLRFVPEADITEILILDDYEEYILPTQKSQWIPVKPYEPPGVNFWLPVEEQHVYEMDEDRELEKLQDMIRKRLKRGD